MALPSIQSQTPSIGYITWPLMGMQYDGVSYGIPAGNSNKKFVIWKFNNGVPALIAVDTIPTDLTGDDKILMINKNGVGAFVDFLDVVEGSLLVQGSVMADAIAANAIQAYHVNANVITGDKLVANAITGREIAANVITSNLIAAGQITADKLSVGTVSDNMVINGSFEDFTGGLAVGWTLTAQTGGTVAPVTGQNSSGAYSIQFDATTTTANLRLAQLPAQYIPVSGATGRKYYVAARLGVGTATTVGNYIRVNWYDANKAYLSANDIRSNAALTTTFTVYEGQATPPASARYMGIEILLVNPNVVTKMYLDEVSVHEVTMSAQIGDGQITAVKVLANSITGDRIQSNTLTALQIQAGTISADKLLVSDRTNYWENPDFEGDTVGGIPRGTTLNATTSARILGAGARGSAKSMELNAISTGNNDVFSTNIFPVEPGDQFYVSMDYKFLNAVGTASAGVGFRTYGPTMAGITWSGVATTGSARPTTWQEGATAKEGLYTVPAGTYYLQPWVTFSNNGETTNRFHVDNIIIRRLNGGELIVDGAIIAAKIATDAITSTKIQADAITGIKVLANSIGGDKITANTLSADRIVANSLTGNQMAANSITGDHIVANTLAGDRITANSVGADRIVANSITSDQILANSIVGADLVINTVSADRIVSNSIGTTQLTANGVNADRLVANTITSREVNANSITGDKITANTLAGDRITANSVGADRIVANSLTAGQIAANTITGDKVGANTIQARSLQIGDFENLFDNGGFDLGTDGLNSWNAGVGTVVANANFVSGKALQNTATGNYQSRYQVRNIACKDGDQFWLSAKTYSDATAAFSPSIRMMFMNVSGAMLANSGVSTGGTNGVYTPIANKLTAPAGTAYARMWVEMHNPNGGVQYIGDLSARRMAAGELIVDGAIKTAHMTANTITGDRVTANTLNGDKVIANTLNADRIIANSIGTTQLTANGINGDRVTANTLNGTKIIANTIGADRIIANAISAREIAARGITSDLIQVSDWTNYAPDYGFEKDGIGWPIVAAGFTIATIADPKVNGTKVAQVVANGTVKDLQVSDGIAVRAGDWYYASCWVRKVGGTGGTAGTVQLGATINRTVGGPSWPSFATVGASTLTNAWYELKGPVQIPADAVSLYIRPSVRNDVLNGTYQFDDVVLRRMNAGELIVDGAIKTSHMTANTINGNIIVGNTLSGDKVTANTLSGDRVIANSIGADRIISNSITATQIQTDTITGDLIKGNAINGKTITGATIQTADPALMGARVVMDGAGLRAYDSSNQEYLTADDEGLTIVGELVAKGTTMSTPGSPIRATVGNLSQPGATYVTNPLGLHFSRDDTPIDLVNYIPPGVTSEEGTDLMLASAQGSGATRSRVTIAQEHLTLTSNSAYGVEISSTSDFSSIMINAWGQAGSANLVASGEAGVAMVQAENVRLYGGSVLELAATNSIFVNGYYAEPTNLTHIVSSSAERDGVFSPGAPREGATVIRNDMGGIKQHYVDGKWSGFAGSVGYVSTQGGYSNYARGYPTTHAYIGHDGRTYMGGMFGITSTGSVSILANTYYTMGTLPVGYRPPYNAIFRQAVSMDLTTTGDCNIYIQPDGQIQYRLSTAKTLGNGNTMFWVSLEGISWRNNNC